MLLLTDILRVIMWKNFKSLITKKRDLGVKYTLRFWVCPV